MLRNADAKRSVGPKDVRDKAKAVEGKKINLGADFIDSSQTYSLYLLQPWLSKISFSETTNCSSHTLTCFVPTLEITCPPVRTHSCLPDPSCKIYMAVMSPPIPIPGSAANEFKRESGLARLLGSGMRVPINSNIPMAHGLQDPPELLNSSYSTQYEWPVVPIFSDFC
jgi:hypothetical protein